MLVEVYMCGSALLKNAAPPQDLLLVNHHFDDLLSFVISAALASAVS
jgi:hypothetical protein